MRPKKTKPCPEGQRRCAMCHRCKPVEDVTPGNKRDRNCNRKYQKAYFDAHPEKYEAHLKRNRERRRKKTVKSPP